MHISEVNRMQEEKEHLMRNEGKHPANDTETHRFKFERELKQEDNRMEY